MQKFLATLAILSISLSAFGDDTFSVATGFDYSSGKYGNATSTDILYIPVTGKYESDKLTLKLTIPYIRIASNGGVLRGIGRIKTSGATKTTHAGLGDISASADYNVYYDDAFSLDMSGTVTLGTADVQSGLGTGQNDYAAELDGYYSIDTTTFFATAGYKIYGAPAGVSLSKAPYGTIGVSQKLSDQTSAGVMLDIAKSPSTSAAGQQEVTVYISQKITSSIKLQADVMKGFSNGSADFGGGVTMTASF